MYVNVTFAIDEEILEAAKRRAEALGTSVNQLVLEYLEQLAGKTDPEADAKEFGKLSRARGGDSRRWHFDREELHERR